MSDPVIPPTPQQAPVAASPVAQRPAETPRETLASMQAQAAASAPATTSTATPTHRLEQVPVGDLAPHPQNARRGNVEAIASSLQQHGQYRAIVANRRNGQIVAGHHTWMAAKSLGWPSVSVEWVDLSEEDHKRVMLADNRTSDLSTNDDEALQALIDELSATETGLLGTGYDFAAEEAAIIERAPAPGSADLLTAPEEDNYRPQFAITIPCEDEAQQQQIYDEVVALGYRPRAVSV